jgi:hypothetical protein
MTTYGEHHEIRMVPKYEETIEGWRAFSVTALNSEGHVIQWSLYERSPDPRRYTGRLKNRLMLRAA